MSTFKEAPGALVSDNVLCDVIDSFLMGCTRAEQGTKANVITEYVVGDQRPVERLSK